MFGQDILVRTRLIPPRLPRRWLRRSRLDQLLAPVAEMPLTLVVASAGYGKSSALASFAARGGWPTAWYSLSDASDEPLTFLLHLVYALRSVAPRAGERTLAMLERGTRGPQLWAQALDALSNDLVLALDDETVLVLDDYHVVSDYVEVRALVDRLLSQRPPRLHLVLASRRVPQLTNLPILRARGELYQIGETDLAFTEEEIADLFVTAYDRALSNAEIAHLSAQTGGWAIALQLIGQTGRPRTLEPGVQPAPSTPGLHLSVLSHAALFDYLAQDVLAGQPGEIQHFLLRSSVLADLRPDACDHVLDEAISASWLQTLYQRGLFLTVVDDMREPGSTTRDRALNGGETELRTPSANPRAPTYRYHPLFHAFLQDRARSSLPDWDELHRRAAAYYQEQGAGEKVLYHLLTIGDTAAAAQELSQYAQPWLQGGRLATLLAWLDQLPPATLGGHPALLIARGDAARLLARFTEAIAAYTAAGVAARTVGDSQAQARALCGQALVYLDTVQPASADMLLRQAFALLPPEQREARAEILRLMAENRVNLGRADQGERLYRFAEGVAPATGTGAIALQARIRLRQGRLGEARALAEAELQREPGSGRGRPPEAHREFSLLLAYLAVLQSEPEAALRYAQQGLEDARRLGSPLSEAVAHARIGHALQLIGAPDHPTAVQHYIQALALSDAIGVARTKGEVYMGLALLHGFGGNFAAAQAAAREGLAAIERSGDDWMAALLWTALGAVGVAVDEEQAEVWLGEAQRRFQRGKDTYGCAVVSLWMSILHQRAGRIEAATQSALDVLDLVQQRGYDGLLIGATLFGPRDRMMLPPVLLAGRADPAHRAAAQALLVRGFPAIAADEATHTYHPGSTLRIQMFDRLRVWRGLAEVEPREWQRKKAQQMLGLLLTFRHRWLLREQICEWLWPEEDQTDAETQFKVTLNALNAALEPARPPRTPPFYIRRQGGAYRFCPPDGVWLDVAEFEGRLTTARAKIALGGDDSAGIARADLEAAVSLYQGDYLSDSLYEEWAREERDRLAARFMEAATTLAEIYLSLGRLPDVVRLCDLILARDPCWEEAYGLLMRAYARQGNRRQALVTYDRCVRNLRDYLGVSPLPQTTQIYEQVKA